MLRVVVGWCGQTHPVVVKVWVSPLSRLRGSYVSEAMFINGGERKGGGEEYGVVPMAVVPALSVLPGDSMDGRLY